MNDDSLPLPSPTDLFHTNPAAVIFTVAFVLIFFGILGGIAAYGVTGIFIGPIVLAVFFTLIKMFYEHYLA